MDNSNHFTWLSFFSQFFTWINQGVAIGEREFTQATSSEGTDMPAFKAGLLTKIGAVFGVSDSYGFGDQIREREVIAREAAKKIGHDDGVVPDEDMAKFIGAEKELKSQMWKLTSQLRGRMSEVAESGIDARYSTMFNSDVEMKAILTQATAEGVPAMLVENVKQTLTNDQTRVLESNAEILKGMSMRR